MKGKDILLLVICVIVLGVTVGTGAYVFSESYQGEVKYSKDHSVHRDLNSKETEAFKTMLVNETLHEQEAIPASTIVEGSQISNPEEQEEDLSFETAEEAIEFSLSRFTEEELERYRQFVEQGLESDLISLTLDIALSRFTEEEIKAIEKALE
ncbi:hypothetical protein [Alkalihalobacillus sp. LMS39]|uniref:hypothetical protein n=1 Tax=Alkalihalobacillus sp. LMS39 TaxID=2924032 RepID=UPI001FB33E21|nr:hypothetical protein [Alkalihalobacillus sp. LMS39]UOE92576.1 hypothetical protein MM271_15185 [Alkalihalobacillus sp. LMS39]